MTRKSSFRPNANPNFDVSSLRNTPRQKRSQALTLRVLCAAERLIREVGYERLTIAMIAQEAEVSVGGLYGRFSNREEIITAVNRQLLERLLAESEQWNTPPATDAFSALRNFVESLVQFFQHHGTLFPSRFLMGVDPAIIAEAAGVENILRAQLVTILSEHQAALGGVDLVEFSAMTLHLCLASLLREAGTPDGMQGRQMTWPVLTQQLPNLIEAYLHAQVGKAKGAQVS